MEGKQSISEKVRSLFVQENGVYKCSLDPYCKYSPKSLVITNCLRHIKENHPVSFNVLKLGQQIPDEEIDRSRGKKRSRTGDDEYATIKYSKQRLMGGLVKLFTIHGLPFRAMSWEGFRDIIDVLLDAFNLKLNEHNIKDHIKETSANIDAIMKMELADRVVSIKFDTTSKLNRSVLAVSAQFYNELKLERRSLGVIELHDKHTAVYLKEKVEELCAKFGLKRWQIHAATVDNGANVVKAVNLMQQTLPVQNDGVESEVSMGDSEDSADLDDDSGLDHVMKVTDEYEESLIEHKVACVRCGSHTINLVVNDVTKAIDSDDDALKHIVTIVKAYRKGDYSKTFKLSKKPFPRIPNKTRWNSHYNMVSEILNEREFLTNLGNQYNELDLSDYWKFLEEYKAAFEPLFEASLKSQKMECGISQFHVEWLKAYGRIRTMKANRFSDKIIESMQKREKILKNNMAYKAALFLDPRFQYNGSELFKPHEKVEIVEYLRDVWTKINKNSPDDAPKKTSKTEEDAESMNSSFDINSFITEMFGQGTSSMQSYAPNSLEEKLQQIQFQDRVAADDKEFNIVHYWYTQKVRDVRLWQIAQVVLAAASSQAAVERDFSAYNLIFTNHRNQLTGDTIEYVLKIRLNRDLLEAAIRETYKAKP